MTAANTVALNLDEKAHGYARIYSSLLREEFQRKRAYASITALYGLVAELEKNCDNVQKAMTLFRNPQINEEYEIADIYVNNWHIDIRIMVDGDAVLLPKKHFETEIVPDFYAVVKISSDVKTAELIGFIDTSSIEKEEFNNQYYSVLTKNLISYDDFLGKTKEEKLEIFEPKDHELFQQKYLALVDGELDKATKKEIIKHLFKCYYCRTDFCCFTGFEMVSCNTSQYPDILDDKTLEIVGANDVDNPKYDGKEEIIDISDTESKLKKLEQDINNDKNKKEETVSDILDELFSIDEMPTVEQKQEEKELELKPNNIDTKEQKDEPQKEKVVDDETIDNKINIENKDEETELSKEIIEEIETIEENEKKLTIENEEDNYKTETIETIDEIEDIQFENQEETSTLTNDVEIEVLDDKLDNEASVLPSIYEPEMIVLDEEDANTIEIHEETKIEEASEELPQTREENIQQVIVDYDEYGDPIYSYINNVPLGEAQDGTSEIEPIDEDITDIEVPNDNIPTVLIDSDTIENIEKINNDFEVIDDFKEEINDISVEAKDIIEDDDNILNTSEIEVIDDNEIETIDDDFPNPVIKEQKDEEETNYEKIDDDILDDEEATIVYKDDEDEEDEENIDKFDDSEYSEEDEEFTDENEEEEEYEDMQNDYSKQNKKKNPFVAIILTILILLGGSAGAFFYLKNNQQNEDVAQSNTQENNIEVQNNQIEINSGELLPSDNAQNIEIPQNSASGTIEVPQLTEEDLIKKENNTTKDVRKVIANAFAQNSSSVSLRNVNWLCTPQLFTDATFKNYLQNLDNLLKLNLRKNILNAVETPQNNSVSVKMAISNDGNLNKVAIAESSGSEQIDNIVLQSINESFEGEKSTIIADGELKSDMYYLKVVIKL